MNNAYERRSARRLLRPDKEDVGAWVAAILGVIFTLGLIFWPSGWSTPTQTASNTTIVDKTDPNQPPPKEPAPAVQKSDRS
jgi:hypothetical protein